MSKVRKKNNPRKRAANLAPILLKHKLVAYTTGEDYNLLVDSRTCKPVKVDRSLDHLLAQVPHPWSILLAAICKDEQGKVYLKLEEHGANRRYLQRELVDHFNTEHKRLLDQANHKHLIGAGYLACPFGRAFDEDQAYAIFEKLGAFDRYRDPETGDVYCLETAEPRMV